MDAVGLGTQDGAAVEDAELVLTTEVRRYFTSIVFFKGK
jgi:hypothetical protein